MIRVFLVTCFAISATLLMPQPVKADSATEQLRQWNGFHEAHCPDDGAYKLIDQLGVPGSPYMQAVNSAVGPHSAAEGSFLKRLRSMTPEEKERLERGIQNPTSTKALSAKDVRAVVSAPYYHCTLRAGQVLAGQIVGILNQHGIKDDGLIITALTTADAIVNKSYISDIAFDAFLGPFRFFAYAPIARPAASISHANTVAKSSIRPAKSGLPAPLPGAGQVVLFYDPTKTAQSDNSSSDAAAAVALAATDFCNRFAIAYNVRCKVVESKELAQSQIADSIRAQNAIVAIMYSARLSPNDPSYIAQIQAPLYDAFGDIFSTKNTGYSMRADPTVANLSPTQQLINLNTRQLSTYALMLPTGPNAVQSQNYFRYALPMTIEQRRGFVTFVSDGAKTTVDGAVSFGTAAEAGLKRGDTIASINGHSVVGISQADLDTKTEVGNSEEFDVVVAEPDGTLRDIRFRRENLAYYLKRRLAAKPF